MTGIKLPWGPDPIHPPPSTPARKLCGGWRKGNVWGEQGSVNGPLCSARSSCIVSWKVIEISFSILLLARSRQMWKKVNATGLHGCHQPASWVMEDCGWHLPKSFTPKFFTFCFCPLVVEVGSTVVLILFQCFFDFFLIFFLCVKGKVIPVKFFSLFFYKRTERGGKISVLLFCKAGNWYYGRPNPWPTSTAANPPPWRRREFCGNRCRFILLLFIRCDCFVIYFSRRLVLYRFLHRVSSAVLTWTLNAQDDMV